MEEKAKKNIYKKWWFWIIVILIVGVIASSNSSNNTSTTSTSSTSLTNNSNDTKIQKSDDNNKKEEQPQESKKEYISKCKTYKYKDIARNPNKYKGKRMQFKGEVIQVQEGFFNQVTLRVNVTKGEYDIWEDTIWVDYTYKDDNESKILEDDIITFYGEFQGQKSYTSVLGSSVTIPQVEAKYIDIK